MDADAEQFMINIHYLSTSINMSMIGIGRSLNEELGLSSLENMYFILNIRQHQ